MFANPIIAFITVFAGGLVSSFSPCSLIIIPLAMSYVGAYSEGNIKRSIIFSIAFSIGLSITFTILGAIAAVAGTLLGDVGGYWKYILAAISIIMGLQMIEVLNFTIPAPKMIKPEQKGLIGALFLGMLYGVASSPCATPILAVLLTYVASKRNMIYGVSLLFTYALAHSFLIFLLGVSTTVADSILRSKTTKALSTYLHKLFGLVFILIGIYILFRLF